MADAARPGPKTLLIFTVGASGGVDDTSAASGTWYIRRYEDYFDHVHLAHLWCRPAPPVTQGRTTLHPLGTGNRKRDLLAAPWRLLRLATQIRATHYLVSDLVWSWWVSVLIILVRRARVHLLPLVIPDIIYRTTGTSLSVRMPIWLEKGLISLSYRFAHRILVGKSVGDFASWFSSHALAGPKTYLADALVEAIPPPCFFEGLERLDPARSRPECSDDQGTSPLDLLYVGRLSHEKMLDHLIMMVAEIRTLQASTFPLRLRLIGNGSERGRLEKLAQDLAVPDLVEFRGYVRNGDLPEHYAQATVFVSPLTGCALREAALCGTPIAAYDLDWIHGLLNHGETALLAPPGDYRELARQLLRLRSEPQLREHLSRNVRALAWRLWSPNNLRESLARSFGD